MNNFLIMWVVFDNPIDFPGQFVARKFLGNTPTDTFFADKKLNAVREWIYGEASKSGQGSPFRMARHPKDDPVIFETWM